MVTALPPKLRSLENVELPHQAVNLAWSVESLAEKGLACVSLENTPTRQRVLRHEHDA